MVLEQSATVSKLEVLKKLSARDRHVFGPATCFIRSKWIDHNFDFKGLETSNNSVTKPLASANKRVKLGWCQNTHEISLLPSASTSAIRSCFSFFNKFFMFLLCWYGPRKKGQENSCAGKKILFLCEAMFPFSTMVDLLRRSREILYLNFNSENYNFNY